MPEKNIQIDGLNISLRDEGQGEPFLILHGWGFGKVVWEKVQNILANNFRVIVVDFPGFGKSDMLPSAWNISDFVEFTEQLLEELKIEDTFYLAGHSFGGRVAIKYAVKNPNKIKKLFLINSAGIRHKRTIFVKILNFISHLFNKLYWVPGYKFIRKIFYRFVLRKTDYIDAKGMKRNTYLKVVGEDLLGVLDQVRVKTYLIWGEKDNITPLKDAYLIHEKIKDSELKIFPWGHIPFKDNPQLLVETILGCLKK